MKENAQKEAAKKLERLYQKYKNLMYHEAFAILKDHAQTEDAIQQSFVKIIANIDKVDEKDEPKTRNYLVIICRNTAIDMYKGRLYLAGDEANLDYENEEEPVVDYVEPAQIVIGKETIARITKAIGELPEIYRDVILLESLHSHTKEEIAKILNVSYETVKKRSLRARKMLLEALEKEEDAK